MSLAKKYIAKIKEIEAAQQYQLGLTGFKFRNFEYTSLDIQRRELQKQLDSLEVKN